MFKSIFGKLMLVFILIIFLSFSITAFMLYYFLGDFVTRDREQTLIASGNEISKSLQLYFENQDNPFIKHYLRNILDSYSLNTESTIFICDKNGYLGFYSSNLPEEILNNFTIEGQFRKLPNNMQYSRILSGENQFIKEQGNFYGLFKETKQIWLTIELPIKYDNKIIGAIYLSSPVPQINSARTEVFKFFLISVAFSILISIVFAYIFSIRITKPLKEINEAASVIAGGEFHKRLEIRSKDEIGQLAVSFNNMVTALKNLEEMRRAFIANVSHELRTPMTSIRGFIDGILDGTIPGDKHEEYLAIVKEETKRLSRLVNDMLDLARMESGEAVLTYSEFNINELLRRCIIKLESIISNKGLEVEASFDEEDMIVNADRDAIEGVIINLIHNAVKFTPSGGKLNLVTLEVKDKIHVSVIDNGIGMDKDEIDMIWDRFYKSDKSRGNDKSGTGLGLAIVKNIVMEHKQKIWVESSVDGGSSFTFTLDRVLTV